uniref:Uncharacterized protein n=1 Tax=Rhizophora mucronata TaxID=61149 RepID=A0A2P2N9R5_RHIMU
MWSYSFCKHVLVACVHASSCKTVEGFRTGQEQLYSHLCHVLTCYQIGTS